MKANPFPFSQGAEDPRHAALHVEDTDLFLLLSLEYVWEPLLCFCSVTTHRGLFSLHDVPIEPSPLDVGHRLLSQKRDGEAQAPGTVMHKHVWGAQQLL